MESDITTFSRILRIMQELNNVKSSNIHACLKTGEHAELTGYWEKETTCHVLLICHLLSNKII
jgi:hypothetical protein